MYADGVKLKTVSSSKEMVPVLLGGPEMKGVLAAVNFGQRPFHHPLSAAPRFPRFSLTQISDDERRTRLLNAPSAPNHAAEVNAWDASFGGDVAHITGLVNSADINVLNFDFIF